MKVCFSAIEDRRLRPFQGGMLQIALLWLQWMVDKKSLEPTRTGMKHIDSSEDQPDCIIDAFLCAPGHDPVLVDPIQSQQIGACSQYAEIAGDPCGRSEYRELAVGVIDDPGIEILGAAGKMKVDIGRSGARRRAIAAQFNTAALVCL